jgi:5-methylcytosine-specific restriction endonuclease McrA
MDPEITLNQKNLILLCKECHNLEHERFQKECVFDSDGNLIKSKAKSRDLCDNESKLRERK